jgi:hypothetical protein
MLGGEQSLSHVHDLLDDLALADHRGVDALGVGGNRQRADGSRRITAIPHENAVEDFIHIDDFAAGSKLCGPAAGALLRVSI